MNVAINLRATVRLRTLGNKRRIVVHSEDLRRQYTFACSHEAKSDRTFRLIGNIIFNLGVDRGVEFFINCMAPASAGLGGSTALSMALCGVLNEIRRNKLDLEQLIDIGFHSELQALRVPGGKQDYYAATYGGLNAVWFRAEGIRVESLRPSSSFMRDLRDRLVLCYAGKSRESAKSNWSMFKNYVDGKKSTVRHMRNIRNIAIQVRQSIIDEDLDAFGDLLGQEMKNRRGLAAGITTSEIDRLVRVAKRNGASSAKVCGAGGGGCVVIFTRGGRRHNVESALRRAGGRVLDFAFEDTGIRTWIE